MMAVNIKWYAETEDELNSLPKQIILPDWMGDNYSDIDRYISEMEECRHGGFTLIQERRRKHRC